MLERVTGLSLTVLISRLLDTLEIFPKKSCEKIHKVFLSVLDA